MTSILTANNRAGRDNVAPAPELHEDGSSFQWRMFFNSNAEIVDADTTGECLSYLIENYLSYSPEDRLDLRKDLARGVQQMARSVIAAAVQPGEVERWEWDLLVWGDENSQDPYGWGDGSSTPGEEYDPEIIDIWGNKHPLVLVTTNYAPFTDVARPMSTEGDYEFVKNIIWIDPSEELRFLQSLSRIGYITFGEPRVIAALPSEQNIPSGE